MKVRPGDTMSASVAVKAHRVTLKLRNVTRRTSFTKTARMSAPDVTSAEWIVEAPSGCDSSGNCRQLDLADFGTVPFTSARATATSGHTGTISDRAWSATRLNLSQVGSSAGPGRGNVSAGPGALASALSAGGGAFSVSYQSDSSFGKARSTMPALQRRVG
jgi:hypothetical protein